MHFSVMEKRIAPRSPRALTAIAAVLALTATPLTSAFAQETSSPVQPAPTVPEQSVPANPVVTPETFAPAIALPQPDSSPPASPLTVAAPPAPLAIASEAPAATVKPETARHTLRAAALHPEPARVPTAENAGTERDGTLARGDAPPAVVSPPITTPPTPVAAQRPTTRPALDHASGFPTEGAIGLLAALGIASAGIFAMARRRRDDHEDDSTDTYSVPDPAPSAMADPMALPANPPARLGPSTEALASGPIPIGEDRRDLLEAMVAAPPDEANPFTSRKARIRRARLILQHREHLQTQGKPFDWRTYRPTTRPSTPSPSEPLVDA